MCPKLFPTLRYAVLLLLLLAAFAGLAPVASAASSVPAVLPAFDMMDVVHDRARLIQFSVAVVALGVVLLWWGQKS
jgi:hypothetical protein